MSEPQPKESNAQVLLFMVILSFVCALILSVLASALAKPQQLAAELDRSKQMMIAAHIISYDDNFLIEESDGKYLNAKYEQDGILVPGSAEDYATDDEILAVYNKRIRPILIDHKGGVTTFEKANIDEREYLEDFKKTGYYKEPLMLAYEILPNPAPDGTYPDGEKPVGYVIPVNGFGLWDAIYGYLAIKPNGNTVIGITWYEHKETPGLGANISEEPWQILFPGKHLFQESPDGTTNFKATPLGITVVKGKVSEVYGDSPRSLSAVDGMAGATLTGNGVTTAYREVLAPYRPFLIKIHNENKTQQK